MTELLHLGSPSVTIAAIVAAAVCAAIAWHTVHRTRRQTADRVAALAAAIHDTGVGASVLREGGAGLAMFSAYDADLSSSEPTPGSPRTVRTTPALIAFGAAAVVTILAGVLLWNAAAPAAAPRDQRPLELARLEHGITADQFTVSGEVAVPAGRSARGLAVELITLDRQGHAIASGGSPVTVDVAPTRSRVPFSVSVPYSSAVNRYTIRFRDVSGLRPHVDRRRVQGSTR